MHIKASVASFERRAQELKLAEDLYNIRTARLNGAKGHSASEVRATLTKTIERARAARAEFRWI